VYCILIYTISISIPSPRTASATHEIAIHPFFETDSLWTSTIYFGLVFLFALNRSRVVNLIGKFLTPLIVTIVLSVIGIGLFSANAEMNISKFEQPLTTGFLEGYQTFDAIGAVLIGGVVIISLNLKGITSAKDKKKMIEKSGIMAGAGLATIYAGLIAVGAFYGAEIFVDGNLSSDMQRANLLRGISTHTLGSIGTAFLSVLVALACFTTAVGIVTGTADYFKGLFNNARIAYIITAAIGSLAGISVGQMNFSTIIHVALPILMFIYPITIALILLNILPEKWASKQVFRAVVLVTFIFSLPDVLGTINLGHLVVPIAKWIPLASQSLGWVIPALVTFILVNLMGRGSEIEL
jgi:LIVCS family branched-chain amino acid:cation transporter